MNNAITFSASILVLLLTASPSLAKWEYSETIDEMTDEKKYSALSMNDMGYPDLLLTCGEAGGTALNIPTNNAVHEQGKSFRYRVDKNPVVEVREKYFSFGNVIVFGPIMFSRQIEANKKAASLLYNGMMTGHQVIFEFGKTRYKISLTGSKAPIARLLKACGVELE